MRTLDRIGRNADLLAVIVFCLFLYACWLAAVLNEVADMQLILPF